MFEQDSEADTDHMTIQSWWRACRFWWCWLRQLADSDAMLTRDALCWPRRCWLVMRKMLPTTRCTCRFRCNLPDSRCTCQMRLFCSGRCDADRDAHLCCDSDSKMLTVMPLGFAMQMLTRDAPSDPEEDVGFVIPELFKNTGSDLREWKENRDKILEAGNDSNCWFW